MNSFVDRSSRTLTDVVTTQAPRRPPLAQLSYDPLTDAELAALEELPALVNQDSPNGDSAAESDDEVQDGLKSATAVVPGPSPQPAQAKAKPTEQDSGFDDGTPGAFRNPDLYIKTESDVPAGSNLFLDGTTGWGHMAHPEDNDEEQMLKEERARGSGSGSGDEAGVADGQAGASHWRSPSLIPSYVPSFLPPFPGLERENGDSMAATRRRREREREAEEDAQAQARARGVRHGLMTGDPWAAPIPYANSMMNEMHPVDMLPPLSPPSRYGLLIDEDDADGHRNHMDVDMTNEDDMDGANEEKRQRRQDRAAEQHQKRGYRRRSLSPPPSAVTTSIAAYRETAPQIPHLSTWLRPNKKRRDVAGFISISADYTISSDSLFGSLPVPATRHASRTPGYLPEMAPNHVHPFNSNIPYTISTPVPPHAASGLLAAPSPHPRVPLTMPRVRQQLDNATSTHLPLFSRTTRIGPPGPLGPKGEALDYEYVGDTSALALNVDWPQRVHSATRLPHTGVSALAGTTTMTGSVSVAATPAPGPGPGAGLQQQVDSTPAPEPALVPEPEPEPAPEPELVAMPVDGESASVSAVANDDVTVHQGLAQDPEPVQDRNQDHGPGQQQQQPQQHGLASEQDTGLLQDQTLVHDEGSTQEQGRGQDESLVREQAQGRSQDQTSVQDQGIAPEHKSLQQQQQTLAQDQSLTQDQSGDLQVQMAVDHPAPESRENPVGEGDDTGHEKLE